MILSPNEMNKYLNTVIIAPLKSESKKYPTRVEVKQDNKIGWVVLDQIRTIDKQRIIIYFDNLTDTEIEKVKLILKELLVD